MIMHWITIILFLLTITGSYSNKVFMEEKCGKTVSLDFLQDNWIRLKPSKRAYYSPNMNCIVTIESDPRKRMTVVFRTIKVEFEPGCDDDYLLLFDGNSTESPRLRGLAHKVCGSRPPPGYYVTTSNKLTVRFKSDSWSSGNGFQIVITSFHTGKCLDGEFKCKNSNCISKNLICDGMNHCGDESEECELDAEAIWGVVGGVLIVAFIGICIATATRRRKREQLRKKKALIIPADRGHATGSCYKLPVEKLESPGIGAYYKPYTPRDKFQLLGIKITKNKCIDHGPKCLYCQQENISELASNAGAANTSIDDLAFCAEAGDFDMSELDSYAEAANTAPVKWHMERSNSAVW